MFKKTLFILLLVVSTLMADQINWEKDFKSGIENATAQDKPVLFVFSRHSCHYCKVLEETTFQDKQVIEILNRDFISIVSYTDENDYTPRELWRPGTPTLWFLKPNGEPRYEPLRGAVDAEVFLKALAIVKKDFDNISKSK